jgi:hypothetical protein
MQNKYSYERHQRQTILKNFGEAGQLKANTGKSIGREPDEMPQVSAFSYKKIPLSKLEDCINGYEKESIVFFASRACEASGQLDGCRRITGTGIKYLVCMGAY